MQPKLQRFVTLTRRSVTSRPKASASMARREGDAGAITLWSVDELQHELVALFPRGVLLQGERGRRLHRLAGLQAERAAVLDARDRLRVPVQLPLGLVPRRVRAQPVHAEPLLAQAHEEEIEAHELEVPHVPV